MDTAALNGFFEQGLKPFLALSAFVISVLISLVYKHTSYFGRCGIIRFLLDQHEGLHHVSFTNAGF